MALCLLFIEAMRWGSTMRLSKSLRWFSLVFGAIILVFQYQNCAPSSFNQESSTNPPFSGPLSLLGVHSDMQSFNHDNWVLNHSNWGMKLRLSHTENYNSYNISLSKDTSDNTGKEWRGCEYKDLKPSQSETEGTIDLLFSNCEIPVEKVLLKIKAFDTEKGTSSSEDSKVVSVPQLKIIAASRNSEYTDGNFSILETRMLGLSIRSPLGNLHYRLKVFNNLTREKVCERLFSHSVATSDNGELYKNIKVHTSRDLSPYLANYDNNAPIDCPLTVGDYKVALELSADPNFTWVGQKTEKIIQVTRPSLAIDGTSKELDTTNWSGLGNVFDQSSWNNYHRIALKQTGYRDDGAPLCEVFFRLKKSELVPNSNGSYSVRAVLNNAEYKWPKTLYVPSQTTEHIYLRYAEVCSLMTGLRFLRIEQTINNNKLAYNEFWVIINPPDEIFGDGFE